MATETGIRIISGPDLWKLSIALFDREGMQHQRATFRVDHRDFSEIDVDVRSAQAAMPVGYGWNLEGYGTVLPQNFGARERVRDGRIRIPSRRVFIYYRMERGRHATAFRSYLRFLDEKDA